ncbi:hypothetical protein, partial [Massilia sp. CCM 8734]|uniref:hypothetical protein n=1 Tax=Massilia sp. CCM 8734 TaxID=2609283 RepID=UPI001AAEFE47
NTWDGPYFAAFSANSSLLALRNRQNLASPSYFSLRLSKSDRLLAVLALRRGVRLARHPLLFAINHNNFCTLT